MMTRPSLLYSTHVSVWPRRRRGSAFLARNLSAPYCSSSFFFWSSFSFSCSSSNRFFARIACHVVSWWGWDGGDEMPSGFQRNHDVRTAVGLASAWMSMPWPCASMAKTCIRARSMVSPVFLQFVWLQKGRRSQSHTKPSPKPRASHTDAPQDVVAGVGHLVGVGAGERVLAHGARLGVVVRRVGVQVPQVLGHVLVWSRFG